MKYSGFSAGAVLGLILLAACAGLKASNSGRPTDESESNDLKSFYENLKEGQSRKEVEKLLNGKRELFCRGNAPAPQRCEVKFRVAAGDDFGADRLGVQIQNATVRDHYRILILDFRNNKLLRWDSQPETIRR